MARLLPCPKSLSLDCFLNTVFRGRLTFPVSFRIEIHRRRCSFPPPPAHVPEMSGDPLSHTIYDFRLHNESLFPVLWPFVYTRTESQSLETSVSFLCYSTPPNKVLLQTGAPKKGAYAGSLNPPPPPPFPFFQAPFHLCHGFPICSGHLYFVSKIHPYIMFTPPGFQLS